ncbi:MAG: hypothetical protein LBJ69_02920, partial [Holosporales bacterium]|nr:hypothetical protein [Holosporales bacterium]
MKKYFKVLAVAVLMATTAQATGYNRSPQTQQQVMKNAIRRIGNAEEYLDKGDLDTAAVIINHMLKAGAKEMGRVPGETEPTPVDFYIRIRGKLGEPVRKMLDGVVAHDLQDGYDTDTPIGSIAHRALSEISEDPDVDLRVSADGEIEAYSKYDGTKLNPKLATSHLPNLLDPKTLAVVLKDKLPEGDEFAPPQGTPPSKSDGSREAKLCGRTS